MRIFMKVFLSLLLCVYLLILTKLVLFKYLSVDVILSQLTFNFNNNYFWNGHNIIPFKTIIEYLFLATELNFNIRVENLLGNIVGFMPFGFILPLLSKKFLRLRSITVATFGLSLTFELFQLIFRFGSFDIDDLILNTLGGVLGYLIVRFGLKMYGRLTNKRISKSI